MPRTKLKTKAYEFPPVSKGDFIKSLTEEEILRVLELEEIRLKDSEHNKIRGVKKTNNFAKELAKAEEGSFDMKIRHYVLNDMDIHSNGAKLTYYYFVQRLAKYLRRLGGELVSEKVVKRLEEIKTTRFHAVPLKVENTNAGLPTVVVDKDTHPLAAKKVEDLEMKYYEIVANIVDISQKMLKELNKKSTKKELKKMSVKELTTTIQKLVYTLSPLRSKKQQNNLLLNINLSNAKREDYWNAFNKVQESFEEGYN